MLRMQDLDLAGRRVLLREDLNAPIDENGRITDDMRIRTALPAIEAALAAGAAVIVVSHRGRPPEGVFDPALSLEPIAAELSRRLEREVRLVRDFRQGVDCQPGDIVLLENIRFEVGEKNDDEALSRELAALCDVYVNDAFATAHRAHASTHGVGRHAPVACAGPLLAAELDALGQALHEPQQPMVAIVGGAKVSTKLLLLERLLGKVENLIVGGGIGNTFLKAAGHEIGNSLCEDAMLDDARRILETAGERIPLPVDAVCAKEAAADARATIRNLDAIEADEMILDLGPTSVRQILPLLENAGTILWNGPLGVFEIEQFASGTWHLARAIASSKAYCIAGGGDTLAAIAKCGVAERISYMSTGGGAFLEYLEGRTLPGVAVLEERARG